MYVEDSSKKTATLYVTGIHLNLKFSRRLARDLIQDGCPETEEGVQRLQSEWVT